MGGVRRRFWLRKSWRRGRRGEGHVFLFLAAAAGIGLALFVIGRIEAEVRPLAELLAEARDLAGKLESAPVKLAVKMGAGGKNTQVRFWF